MRIFHLVRKELIEILRQREMLAIMFIAPILQTVILGYVVTTDVKNIPVGIVDLSGSRTAQKIIHRIESTSLFNVRQVTRRPSDYREIFKRGEVKSIIVFRDEPSPGGEAVSLPGIQILMDGMDANSAGIAAGYFNGIIRQFYLEELRRGGAGLPVRMRSLIRFNPSLESINYMGPGIVALLLTLITMFLTSISLVREKEQQTMDTLLISRLTPIEIYLGKAIPMALLGLLEMGVALAVVLMIFHVPLRGNLIHLLLAAVIFLFAILSYALLISTFCSSQQQALFFSWFSIVVFLLLSGLFTPVENIPPAFRWLSDINPLRYLIKIIRDVFLKGNGPAYFYRELLILGGITVAVISVSLLNFKRMVSK